jgi:hypothetical protein
MESGGALREMGGCLFGEHVNGITWEITQDPVDETVCVGVNIGGGEACVLTRKLCSVQSHVKHKSLLLLHSLYFLAGDPRCQRTPAALLGSSVPTDVFADHWLGLVGPSLSRTEFEWFGNILHMQLQYIA